ncbi:MAG TPA: amidase [Steroidobacteraceae bacterium]|jgi:amidase
MPRRDLGSAAPVSIILALGVASAVTAAPKPAELTVVELHDELARGTTSVKALEKHYAARIAALDSKGPTLRAVLEVNPDAAAIAARLDASHEPKGLLYGVPVLLKDNVDTADRMLTTAGSLALTHSRPPSDAFIVSQLRASNALILGKTNLSEWANFRSKRSSSGWSGRGGQTRNPYALDRSPCGSSSGSAVAVAADLAVVAVGTETDGSIVCPASVNGLVGIKPTVGLVSRTGIIPISASQDTAGPIARTVADAAALLSVIAGYDAQDPATLPLKDRPPLDYTKYLNPDALKGARIGVLRKYAGFHERVDAVFEKALELMKAHGAVIVDPVEIPKHEPLDADEQTVLLYEFKDGINRYLAKRTTGPRTLADLIAFNERERAREMPYFPQDLFLEAQAKGPLSEKEYLDAHERARRAAGPEGIDAALAKDHLDVLIAPTVGAGSTIDLINGDHFVGGEISSPPAVAGYPHITVPMGAVDGLPLGLSFVGSAWSEDRLIGYAYAFEQASHARRPPEFRPSVP